MVLLQGLHRSSAPHCDVRKPGIKLLQMELWKLRSNKDYYHVVVSEGASILNKACNSKCQIFNGSLVNCTPELSKPSSAIWCSRV